MCYYDSVFGIKLAVFVMANRGRRVWLKKYIHCIQSVEKQKIKTFFFNLIYKNTFLVSLWSQMLVKVLFNKI